MVDITNELVAKKIVKKITIILGIFWFLVLFIYIFFTERMSFPEGLILIPLVIVGLRSYNKKGLIATYIIAGTSFFGSLLGANLIGTLVWAGVLYDAHRIRSFYK